MTRALIFDLDDTLLDSTKRIRPEDRQALFESRECGFQIILATSRPIRTVRRFVDDELLGVCTVISLNGAMFHYPRPGNPGVRFGSIGAHLFPVLDSLEKTGEEMDFSIETDGVSFSTNATFSPSRLWKRHSATPDMVIPIGELNVDLVTKVAVNGQGKKIPRTISLANDFPELRFIPAVDGTFVNVVPLSVDKSTTLEKVSEQEKIDLKSSFAFGDDIPDIDMFAVTGMSIAMENGADEVKNAASITIGHCDSDTIADFIRDEIL